MKCLYCDGPYEASIANCKLCYNCSWQVFPVGYDDTRESLHIKVKDDKAPIYEQLTHATRPDGKVVKILDFWIVNILSIDKKKDFYELEVTNEPKYC